VGHEQEMLQVGPAVQGLPKAQEEKEARQM
jgi:hypothetical protein